MKFQDISSIKGYHAHVYFDEATVEQAKALCEEAGKLFGVTVGRMHHRAIGPHPSWSFKLARSLAEETSAGSLVSLLLITSSIQIY